RLEAFFASLVSVAFHGAALGMILYVISVGLSVTMGLMGFANLAHGVFAMAGGYILTTAISRFGAPFPLALALALALVAAATFALGSGLAGLGGGLGAEIIAIQPSYPFENLVYFLVVVSVGGLGSLRGPFVAALLIGIADTACKYWLPQFGAFPIYVATIAVL